MSDKSMSKCHNCGASVYPEHVDTGIARYEGGKLLCVHCVEEYEAAHDSSIAGAIHGGGAGAISVEPESAGSSVHQVVQQSIKPLGESSKSDESRFKRSLDPASPGGTRCRVFHSKLNEGAIGYMTDAINDWLDQHADIVIKNSSSTIGVFEGKHADPNLILTLFY